MAEPHSSDRYADRAALDISRVPTVRLVSPEVAGDIARHRAELALSHEMEAVRLRQLADAAMSRFERASDAVMDQLDEWLTLHHISARTPAQQARHSDLMHDLERLEAGLATQWQAIAELLRKASHHEASAEILRAGRVHH
jgi:hypothetical protein